MLTHFIAYQLLQRRSGDGCYHFHYEIGLTPVSTGYQPYSLKCTRSLWKTQVGNYLNIKTQINAWECMLKELCRGPQFNERVGLCLLCEVTPERIREACLESGWRRARLEHWRCIARLLKRRLGIRTMFEARGVSVDISRSFG